MAAKVQFAELPYPAIQGTIIRAFDDGAVHVRCGEIGMPGITFAACYRE